MTVNEIVEDVEIEPTEIGEADITETQDTDDSVVDETTAPEGQAETLSEYQPDFTYKVGKDQKEFPEFLRNVVNSKEVEENLRDLMTRADGLPVLKNKLDEVVQHNQHYERVWEQLGELRATDPAAFLDAVNLPKASVLKAFSEQELVEEYQKRQEFNQLPDFAKQQLQERSEFETRERQQQRQLAYYQSQQNEMVIQQFEMQLGQPQVNEVREAYDAMYGEGAFRKQAIRHGDYLTRTSGRVAPPDQVIHSVMSEVRPAVDFYLKQQANQKPVTTTPSHQAPATIPSIGKGGTQSPTKRKINSIDDIRAEYERRQASS